jgi:hypothetical protein
MMLTNLEMNSSPGTQASMGGGFREEAQEAAAAGKTYSSSE